MKLTKPTIVVAAVVTLLAGTGVAFAATDTFITKAPETTRPVRTWYVPEKTEAPAQTNTTNTPLVDNSSDNNKTSVDNQTNNVNESEPVNEPAPANEIAPTAQTPEPVQAPVTNNTNVSNENSNTSVGSNPDVSVSHN